MTSPTAFPKFTCRNICQHHECQQHAQRGEDYNNMECQCLGKVNASSVFNENAEDLAVTLAHIMVVCHVPICQAMDTIYFTKDALVFYDQVCHCLDAVPKKVIRKEDLLENLNTKLSEIDAFVAFKIIKHGFKAFHYKLKAMEQRPKDVDGRAPDNKPTYSKAADSSKETNSKAGVCAECPYLHAARKTAEYFSRISNFSAEEQRNYEDQIKELYLKYCKRMLQRSSIGRKCNCCYCARKRGYYIYGKSPPCSSKPKPKRVRCCPKKKPTKKKKVQPILPKCPICHRIHKFCICTKTRFSLEFVKSIWDRPDFEEHYMAKIDDNRKNSQDISGEDSLLNAFITLPSAEAAKVSQIPEIKISDVVEVKEFEPVAAKDADKDEVIEVESNELPSEAAAEAGAEAATEAAPQAAPEAPPEAAPEAAQEAAQETAQEAAPAAVQEDRPDAATQEVIVID